VLELARHEEPKQVVVLVEPLAAARELQQVVLLVLLLALGGAERLEPRWEDGQERQQAAALVGG
jgi:hypothetical protein